MLKALYDYAIRHHLTLPDGYVLKTVKAYISLSSARPEDAEIIPGDDEPIPCPDIGSLANGTEKSNVLVEKRSVIIPDEPTAKSAFYRNALRSLGMHNEKIRRCADVLEDRETVQKLREKLDQHKIKPGDRITFCIDGQSVLNDAAVLPWWLEFRKQFTVQDAKGQVPCLITGQLTAPVSTTPPVSGLHSVGGHPRGDALICFDKQAFCSYDLKQAANAPVSEAAVGAVKAALDHLLENAPTLAGMKFVHWYDCDVPREKDPIFLTLFSGLEEDDREYTEIPCPSSADTWESGLPSPVSYHILLLTGVGGRVMIRGYAHGRYEQLQQNLAQWNRDLSLINSAGSQDLKPCKITARLLRLLQYQKSDHRIFERLSRELSGITPAILTAILTGSQLPDVTAVRALTCLRSELLNSGDTEQESSVSDNNLDGWACQWLKVWLLRKNRKNQLENKELLMEEYNMDHPETAYHCGGLLAVYAAVQQSAYKDANVLTVQRYYTSAIQTPALVLGRLSRMNMYHMEKLELKGTARRYANHLNELNTAIGDSIPETLTLEEQSYFALGYYQMTALLRREQRAGKEAAKNKKSEAKE